MGRKKIADEKERLRKEKEKEVQQKRQTAIDIRTKQIEIHKRSIQKCLTELAQLKSRKDLLESNNANHTDGEREKLLKEVNNKIFHLESNRWYHVHRLDTEHTLMSLTKGDKISCQIIKYNPWDDIFCYVGTYGTVTMLPDIDGKPHRHLCFEDGTKAELFPTNCFTSRRQVTRGS